MSDSEMLREMRQDIRDIHHKLDRKDTVLNKKIDEHIESNNRDTICIQKQLSAIREKLVPPQKVEDLEKQVHTNRISLSLIIAVCILSVPPFIGWVASHISATAVAG